MGRANTTNAHSTPADSRLLHFPGVLHLPPLSITTLFCSPQRNVTPRRLHAPGNYGNGSSLACLGAGARRVPSGDFVSAGSFDKARLLSPNVLTLASARPGSGAIDHLARAAPSASRYRPLPPIYSFKNRAHVFSPIRSGERGTAKNDLIGSVGMRRRGCGNLQTLHAPTESGRAEGRDREFHSPRLSRVEVRRADC